MFSVGLNASSLNGPMTGVGRYTLEVAKALVQANDMSAYFFKGREWQFDLTGLDKASIPFEDKSKTLIPNERNTFAADNSSWVTTLKNYLRRRYYQQAFQKGARAHKLALCHEPNYLAYPFSARNVLTVHDLSWLKYPQTQPVQRLREMNYHFSSSLEQADQVITVSDSVRQELLQHFGLASDKVVTTYLGVDEAFAPYHANQTHSTLAQLKLTHGSYFLCVGTLEPRKNLVNTLRAYAQLPSSIHQQYPLVIAGMGGWRQREISDSLMQYMSRLPIQVLGYTSQQDLQHLYAGARALLFMSLYEGFGLPLVEAMASGCPVLTSHDGATKEVVGDAGLLSNPLDIEAVAHEMHRIAEDDHLYEKCVKSGFLRAQQFKWDTFGENTLNVYRRLLS